MPDAVILAAAWGLLGAARVLWRRHEARSRAALWAGLALGGIGR